MPFRAHSSCRAVCTGIALALLAGSLAAAEVSSTELREILEQNRRLQEQVRTQQRTIDELSSRLGAVVQTSERHERELRGLQDHVEVRGAGPSAPRPDAGERTVRISGGVGIGYFDTGHQGQFAHGEFRVDDPVIAVEAPVAKNVYFYTELKLLPRETNVEDFELGEFYVDFEDLSATWGAPGLLSLRVGRLNVPFGEEYLVRTPTANPLISHSLSDIWGVDEGVEIYGRVGPAQYVIAVQNGGNSRLRDFDSDKAVVARIGWDPARWLHVSGSAMRTGELATVNDNLSEVWFGNAFFRSIGPSNRTPTFWANLLQFDATSRWKGGHLGVSLGHARYDDSDPLADNARTLRYGHVEFVQTLTGSLYGALRHSEIHVQDGYPLAGWGTMGAFFFRPVLTEKLRRTSLGLGYRFSPPLLLKVEYAWESGRTTAGVARDNEDFFGTELAVKF